MGEIPGGVEDGNSVLSFESAIGLFPPEEQERAKEYADIRNSLNQTKETRLATHELVDELCQKLYGIYGEDVIREGYRLFNLLAGSSKPASDWKRMEFDTPNNDFENFFEKKLTKMVKDPASVEGPPSI